MILMAVLGDEKLRAIYDVTTQRRSSASFYDEETVVDDDEEGSYMEFTINDTMDFTINNDLLHVPLGNYRNSDKKGNDDTATAANR